MNTVITAEKIQKELLLTQEDRTSEAIAVLKEDAASNSRAERLSKLGFTSTPAATAYRNAKFITDSQQECERLYPGLKFISFSAMQNICDKYDLVVDEIGMYRGDVPDWAIDVIERSGVARWEWWVSIMQGSTTTSQGFNSEQEARDHLASTGLPGWVHSKSNLLIAAPIKDMQISPSSYRLPVQRSMNLIINDPIVCISVNGGYAVVCAWGEEGQDPMVFNASQN